MAHCRYVVGVAIVAFALYARPARAQTPAEQASADTASVSASTGPQVEELSAAELESLGLDAAGPRVDTSLHFWGFADFNSTMFIHPRGGVATVEGKRQSFYVGNLNLYFSKNLSESFRTMAEVRLTYLPNGSFSLTNGAVQTDTSVFDYANGQVVTRWGGIILQRVYLEWTLHRLLSVRGGQFLSPYGIWNVDHGTPAIIPAQKPLALLTSLYPERQTGLEFFGRWNLSNDQTLGYHLTLSNGTGPISEYKDLDRNKAVGGRVYWERFGKTYSRMGISGYYGRATNSTPTATIHGSNIDLMDKVSNQYDDLSLAGDVLIRRGGLRLQTEFFSLQRRYTSRGRVVHTVLGAPVASGFSADVFSYGGYFLAAYRFGWYGVMPFVTFQGGDISLDTASVADARFGIIGVTGGLNISPIDSVVFKLEYVRGYPQQGPTFLTYKLQALDLQAAWSF